MDSIFSVWKDGVLFTTKDTRNEAEEVAYLESTKNPNCKFLVRKGTERSRGKPLASYVYVVSLTNPLKESATADE